MLFGGLFRSLTFQDPAKVCIKHLVHGGGCSDSWGRLLYVKCHTAHLTCRKHFPSKCRYIPHDHQEQVSKCSVCSLKQSNSRDISEGLDDTTILIIGDGGSHVLDTVTVFHLTFVSSHSLRGIDLFYIISDLKSLETQNSLHGLLVAFNHHRKFRSFL